MDVVDYINDNSSGSSHSTPEEHEDFTRFVESYPRSVPETHGEGRTRFEQWRHDARQSETSRFAPFDNEDEWDLIRWMGQNLGHNQIEDFLKLRTVRCDLSVGSKYTFFQKVDSLPSSQQWLYDDITVVGDRKGEDGKFMTERVEVWRRDPLECVRELIGNPEFRDSMGYTPEKVFADMGRNVRIYDEMWTGDWWWERQTKLPGNATIAPVILASDKTMLTQFRGDQVAWPVYLSIGNIAKETRRKVSARATVLVGYIPVTKLECYSKGPERSLAGYRLFHRCMRTILEPLLEAGKQGEMMMCADGRIRRVFPLLAAYIADHPEQCLVVNVKESFCPKGKVDSKKRGELCECLLRTVDETMTVLQNHKDEKEDERFTSQGLRPIYEPFWKDFPHCNMFECITPDILHQLHKGVFKDHLMAWVTKIVGEEELDRRFKAMAKLPGLRYFKKGISGVSQWTGAEHKEMQKVIVGLLAAAVSEEVMAAVQALVDFIYYAQFHVHTDITLGRLCEALETFHANKAVFERLGIRDHFNIPKLHAILHYLEFIRQRGCLDGFNTELSERLHIDFAKEAYRAGNHHDYIAYMTLWLLRQEKLHLRQTYLEWLARQEFQESLTGQAEEPLLEHESDPSNEGLDAVVQALPRYSLAKKCAYPRRSVATLQSDYGAHQFHPAMYTFVRENFPNSPVRPTSYTSYDVYRQLKVLRAWNPYIGNKIQYDRIRAIPAVPEKGRKRAVPGAFDTALVVADLSAKRSYLGLRAARVRVIFNLLPQFLPPGQSPQPLAYVEWYTPFTRVDPQTRMHYVARSTRNRLPNASVVKMEDIVAPCHLIPRCNAKIDHSWSSDNILEVATHFFVNPYISIDVFSSSGLYTRYC
ncbi:hypothetical protein K474DRAFT_1601721 [Panus rudis PR-1116 ss-1]|nr:hypothetical protein K474DRAFT_1601721 [Panus rudis PR-1116 ss-1]